MYKYIEPVPEDKAHVLKKLTPQKCQVILGRYSLHNVGFSLRNSSFSLQSALFH